MADYIAVHNGPQGTGDGSSVANGMSLQGAVDACTTAGDRVLVANTGTYTITSSITFATAGPGTPAAPKWIIGANASGVVDGTRPTLGHGYGISFFDGAYTADLNWNLRYLNLAPTSSHTILNRYLQSAIMDCHVSYSEGTGSTLWRWTSNCSGLRFERCSMRNTHATRGGSRWFYATALDMILVDCYAENVAGFGIGNRGTVYERCVAKNCAVGFNGGDNSEETGMAAVNCVAYDCGVGAVLGPAGVAIGCTFADNTTAGVSIHNNLYTCSAIVNCIIAHSGGYGVQDAGGKLPNRLLESGNIFWQNTSGDIQGQSISASSQNADPQFANRASDDYSTLPTSPALQVSMPFTYTSQARYADLGALVPQVSGGGMFRRMARMIGAS